MAKSFSDNEKIAALYRRYFTSLLSVGRAYLSCAEDAEDAVQETFLRLSKVIDRIQINDAKAAKALCFTVMKNICIDMLRKEKRRALTYMDPAGLEEAAPKEEDPAEKIADEPFSGNEELYLAVRKLPREMQTVLEWYYYYNLSTSQIAKLLKIKTASVYKALSRAKKELKTILEGGRNEQAEK